MKVVLVACLANRGRSPIAAAFLRELLAQRTAQDVTVDSAGLCAYELGRAGLPAHPQAVAIAARFGLDLTDHVAKALTPQLIEQAALIIVMERWQVEAILSVFPSYAHKVYTLRQLAGEVAHIDIPDIAGKPVEVFLDFCEETRRCLNAAVCEGALGSLLD